MSSWTSVLQQIAELDPDDFDPADLSDEHLRETMPLAHVALNRLSAVLTRCVAAGEARQVHAADGSGSMKAWLTGYLRMSGTEAAGYVRAGRRLSQLPELAAAYADGAVSAAHVQVVTAALTPTRLAAAAETGVDVATTDRVFTEAARALGPEDTGRAVRRWVLGVDPDGTLDDDAGLPRVLRLAPSSGGRVYLSGHLDAVGGETVHAALEAVMNGHRPAGDRRSHAERQGDTLVELCRQLLASGTLPTVRGERPQVRVTIDLVALCAERGVGELPFAGPITAETARRLACDASVVRLITGPAGLPMDVGRAQRTAPALDPPGRGGQRRALRLHRLYGTGRLVRHPPRDPLGLRRGDLLRQRRPDLRTPPHRRPRGRLPGHPRRGHRRLAHLPTRRHRGPDPRSGSLAARPRHRSEVAPTGAVKAHGL